MPSNKVLREKSVFVDLVSQRFFKKINNCYKNKMKTYCMKCRKYTENIDLKMVRTKNNRLIVQSEFSVLKNRTLKSEDF